MDRRGPGRFRTSSHGLAQATNSPEPPTARDPKPLREPVVPGMVQTAGVMNQDPQPPPDGFGGQRMHIVPLAVVKAALAAPVTSQLLVTDCGYFPSAAGHRRVRPRGARQAVVVICSEGAGWVEIGGNRHPVGPRQAVLIPPGQPHSYGAAEVRPWTIWWVHLDGEQVPNLLRACGATLQRPVLPVSALARCTSLVAEVIDHLESDQTLPGQRAASGAAWHLMTTLADTRAGMSGADAVERIRERLAQDLTDPLSITELAAGVSLSPSYLTAVFKGRTGYTPMQYRTLLRMQRARELLDTSDKPIAAVAREVGYDDVGHFSRRFSSLHELGPRAYRRSGRSTPDPPRPTDE